MPRGNRKNLDPVSSKEEAIKRGRAGGIKSGEARVQKKLLSERYAKILAEKFDIDGQTLDDIIFGVLKRKDSASVSMLKEIREATEGQNVKLSGDSENPIENHLIVEFVKSKE